MIVRKAQHGQIEQITMKFTILEPIAAAPVKRTVFKLVVQYEHGDADVSTNETFYMTEGVLSKALPVVNAMQSLGTDYAYMGGAGRRADKLAEVCGISLEDATAIAEAYDRQDLVYGSACAVLYRYTLTYLDEHGVEHGVLVSLDDASTSLAPVV